MTTTSYAISRLCPIGGVNSAGKKIGYIEAGAKAAQNDTWTCTNAKTISTATKITVDATGAAEPYTISGNVITLTSATATACSGLIVYT